MPTPRAATSKAGEQPRGRAKAKAAGATKQRTARSPSGEAAGATGRKPRNAKTSRPRRRKTTTVASALPATARLFDVTTPTSEVVREDIERVPLAQITLAENPRRSISPEGIDRLAGMLMRSGQLTPAIGRRVSDTEVVVYTGQRRLLAARRSHELAGGDGYEGLRPVVVLRVKLLDHVPTRSEIREIQAQENQHEDLSMADRQEQFIDCWLDHPGLFDDERVAAVCRELGIAATLAHNLRRQMTLPEEIRLRVAERPVGGEISITLANQLAAMHEISPALTAAVASRITTTDHQQQALQSLGAFVYQTVVEIEDLYAVRIDQGSAVLAAQEQIERAHEQLSPEGREVLAAEFAVEPDALDAEIKKLATAARNANVKVDVDGAMRDRAIAGRYAWVFERGADYADAVWVTAPEFMICELRQAVAAAVKLSGLEDSVFSAAKIRDDEDVNAAGEKLSAERALQRERAERGRNSNLGLGEDIDRSLLDPTAAQLDALRRIVAHIVCEQFPSIVAYGAGWSDRARQQPVGDTDRFEPRSVEAVVDAELQRALSEQDPIRGMLQIITRFVAAFMLDRNGVTATSRLGSARMQGRLARALPDGPGDLRRAMWDLMRPILSPRLQELNRHDFVLDDELAPAADLAAHRAESALADINLGEEQPLAA